MSKYLVSKEVAINCSSGSSVRNKIWVEKRLKFCQHAIRYAIKVSVFAALFLFATVSLFAQEKVMKEKISYSNVTEFGFFTTSPQSFGLDITTVHGFSVNKQHHIGLGFGIGGGFHKSYDGYYYSPIFLNYRLCFKSEKTFSPHVNVSLGGMIAIENIVGIYSSIAAGFKTGAFSFSSGLSFMPFCVKEKINIVYLDYMSSIAPAVKKPVNKWFYPFGLTLKFGFAF